jgi:phage shock protein PspC (stress-responsive transcriptional regulator)
MTDDPRNSDPLHPEEPKPYPPSTRAPGPADRDLVDDLLVPAPATGSAPGPGPIDDPATPATAADTGFPLGPGPDPGPGPADEVAESAAEDTSVLAGPAGAGAAAGATGEIPPGVSGLGGPPPPAPAPPVRRLVRDPYTRLGGVCSGIAHYYGLDVSLVRIVVLLLALTTGVGLLAYLLAWLIIPRADYWPPAGVPRPVRSLSNRDLGVGLAAVGLVFALAIGGGGFGGFLVPLVLVGGGVWLLLQPAAPVPVTTSVAFPGSAPGAAPGPAVTATGPAGGGFPPTPPSAYVATAPPAPQGAPVPPRSRRRRFGLATLVILAVLFLLAIPLLLVGAFFAAISSDSMDFGGDPERYTPTSVTDDFPLVIDREDAAIEVDLTELEGTDFAGRTNPVLVDLSVDFGRIEVIVPDGLEVSVDASSTFGDVDVFDESDDGFSNDITVTAEDPDLELRLDAGAGEVVVRRG